jgi:hypothetical protein
LQNNEILQMPLPCLGLLMTKNWKLCKCLALPCLIRFCKINMRILQDLELLLPFMITIGKNEGIAIILPFYNLWLESIEKLKLMHFMN